MLSELKTSFLMGFQIFLAVLVDRFGGGSHHDFDGHDDVASQR